MSIEKKFFDGPSVLESGLVHLQESPLKKVASLAEALPSDLKGSYLVLANYLHKLRLGNFTNGEFSFYDSQWKLTDKEIPDEEYLQEMRVFNKEREILIHRVGEGYEVRTLDDSGTADKNTTAVDTKSNFFGERVNVKLPDGFVCLREEGRKIELIVPAKEIAVHYALVTRSYIEYDEDTGQAGYGKYRFVDIVAVEGGKL